MGGHDVTVELVWMMQADGAVMDMEKVNFSQCGLHWHCNYVNNVHYTGQGLGSLDKNGSCDLKMYV